MAKDVGFHKLGVKPGKPMGGPSQVSQQKEYNPSMHIGHESGVDLPAGGPHEFHIKAMVGKTVRQRPGGEPEISHDLEITHIKHIGPKGATKSAEDATDGLDKELGKIQKEKLGKNQGKDQSDSESGANE